MDNLPSVVRGRRVADLKRTRAKELRREMTDAERLLWDCLRTNRFHGLHFRRQQIIAGFVVDFYCHAHRLVIEVDGGVHDEQQDYDQQRDTLLTHYQLTVLRLPNDLILHHLPTALDEIAFACGISSQEITHLPPPSPWGRGIEGVRFFPRFGLPARPISTPAASFPCPACTLAIAVAPGTRRK